MAAITEQMVRSRAEHNESILSSLEEISLHQQDIIKIDHLDKWCKHLKILYLQSNLISKIENVARLKSLEYLNLAMNNIEIVQNLSKCESLQKLDLTMNFVRVLSNFKNELGHLEHFKTLYLTGNPVTNFEHYRDYVIASLPQLDELDGISISKTDKIKAQQIFSSLHNKILHQEDELAEKRTKQKLEYAAKEKRRQQDFDINLDPDNDPFWQEEEEYTPESRLAAVEHMKMKKLASEKKTFENQKIKEPKREKRQIKFFNKNGDPINVNSAKIDFSCDYSDDRFIMVNVYTFKHLDTNLIKVDLQPKFVKIKIKNDYLQLVFQEDVLTSVEYSSVKRSETTGHLLIKCFKASCHKKVSVENKDKPVKRKKLVEDSDDDLPDLI